MFYGKATVVSLLNPSKVKMFFFFVAHDSLRDKPKMEQISIMRDNALLASEETILSWQEISEKEVVQHNFYLLPAAQNVIQKNRKEIFFVG